MNATELQAILAAHKLWLNGETGGTRADLTGAVLTRADLTRADLRGADLRGAVLTGAVLTGADLTRADLTGADLTRADLRGAVLTGAVLTRADLTRADLRGAVLTGADLTRADLRDAVLRDAVLTRAVLRDAVLSTNSPPSFLWHTPDPTLPRRVAEAATKEGALNMCAWHTCDTTHCLAGWAIHLSGEVGKVMEALTSPSVAGTILMPSASGLFFSRNDQALAWCREQLNDGCGKEAVA